MNKFELTHDILAKKVFKMISVEEKELKRSKKSIENRLEDYNRGCADLFNKKELIYYEPLLAKLKLSGDLDQFIAQSIEEAERLEEKERRRVEELTANKAKIAAQKKIAKRQAILKALLIILFLGAVILAFYALCQRDYALDRSKVAQIALQQSDKDKIAAQKSESDALKEKDRADSTAIVAEIEKNKAQSQVKVTKTLLMASKANNFINEGRNTEALRISQLAWATAKTEWIDPPTPLHQSLSNAFYNAQSLQFLKVTHTDRVNSVAFSPDGQGILTGSRDETAILWDLQGNKIQEFKGHTDAVNSVAFSPDGQGILTGSWDKTAILWDLQGNKIQEFKGHTDTVHSVTFSPYGKSIFTGSWDKTAILWDYPRTKF